MEHELPVTPARPIALTQPAPLCPAGFERANKPSILSQGERRGHAVLSQGEKRGRERELPKELAPQNELAV